MAVAQVKVTTRTVTKMVPVESEVEEREYTLILNQDEADFLYDIIGGIGGSFSEISNIYDALYRAQPTGSNRWGGQRVRANVVRFIDDQGKPAVPNVEYIKKEND